MRLNRKALNRVAINELGLAGSAAVLEASMAMASSLAPSLTTGILLGATPGSVSTLSPALTTSINLAGSYGQQSTLSGVLLTQGQFFMAIGSISSLPAPALTTDITMACTMACAPSLIGAFQIIPNLLAVQTKLVASLDTRTRVSQASMNIAGSFQVPYLGEKVS